MELPEPGGSIPLEPIMEIHDEAGGPLIGQMGCQTFGSSGQVYVSDYRAMVIQEYDAEGVFVRTIGSRGQGRESF